MRIGGLQKFTLIDFPEKLACSIFISGCPFRCSWCHNPELVLPDKIEKSPIYRDFRKGDIRHSNANISKAQNFVGYAPTHDIYDGMQEAISWYIENISSRT